MSLDADNERQLVRLRRRVFSLPTLLSFVLAIAIIYLLATRFDVDWSKTWDGVRHMNAWLYLLALGLYYLSFGVRGLRWRMLARNAGIFDFPNARLPSVLRFSQLIIIGWFVNAVAWLRLGDPYRAYELSRESRSGFAWSLGTVLAERVMDMAAVLALVLTAVAWYSLTRESAGTGTILLAAVAMTAALGAFLVLMKGYGGRLAGLMPGKFEDAYQRFHKGAVGGLRQLPALFVLGLIGWLLEVGRLYFVVQALDLTIGIPLVLITALGHAILSTVPTPGGIGVVEPGVTGLLVLGLAREDAVAVVLVDRSITYLSVIVFGGITLLQWHFARSRRRRYQTPRAGQVAPPS